MARNWRAWVLLVLLVGPVLVYIGLGSLWLFEHGWLLVAGSIWVGCGLAFTVLAARWTRATRPVLPPIDWEAPTTFSRTDRDAWALVEAEAESGETVPLDRFLVADTYIDTGRRLAGRLAAHYHPHSDRPIEQVPVVDLLTALELAAEDLAHLGRQVPGGDLFTPDHWRKATKVAGYVQRANDVYAYLLPIFSPISGLARLAARQWMVRPAWRDMQQNLLRWFFRAYVNRLGMHLIELYSGRLSIGADQYRRLTRRETSARAQGQDGPPPVTIAVAGARQAGKSRLIALIEQARSSDPAPERLARARLVEVPGYAIDPAGETARDGADAREALRAAVEADMLVLVVDARRDTLTDDAAFARAWDGWFVEHPALDVPPAMAVVTGLDHPELGGDWSPPHDWEKGQGPRETVARARLASLRAVLPPSFSAIAAVGLPESRPFGVIEQVLPAMVGLLGRAERVGLVRHLHRLSSRSKAGRLASQVGERARWLWSNLRSRSQAGPMTR